MEFIDIHSHILPGLDDGPGNEEESIVAARSYVDIGVERVIATPHCIQGSRWAPGPDAVFKVLAETQQKIDAAGIPLQLLAGMEIAVNDILSAPRPEDRFVSLGDTGVFLIEFPLNTRAQTLSVSNMANMLASRGTARYIIAHPERCPLFQESIEEVNALIASGMLIQVNIASVLGHYGKKARDTVFHLFRSGWVHFLATDSHGRIGRMPPTPHEMAELSQILGTGTIDQGFRANPLRLLNGEEILPLRTEPKQHHGSSAGKVIRRFRKIFNQNVLAKC